MIDLKNAATDIIAKALTVVLVVAIALLVSSTQRASAEPYTVKIGAILPLSGDLAHVGNDIREGLTLGLEEHNSSKLRFDFVWEDGRFSMRDSVSAAKKLIAVDKVDVIISLWDTADVIAPLTEQSQVIQLSIRWNPEVAAKYRFTFTFESTFHSYFRDVAKLIQREKISRVAFLSHETQSGTQEFESFKNAASECGIKIVANDSFQGGTTDFRAILTRLLIRKPELIVLTGFPPATPIIMQNLRGLNPKMRHTGFYEVITDYSLIEGQPFVSQFGFLDDFSKKFEKRFGRPFTVRAPHGYEIVRILDWAYATISLTEKPSTAAVAAQLERLKEFPSILGPLSINNTRNIEHQNFIKVVRDGKLVPYGE